MKNNKFYILLAPIIISAIFCAYSGNESYKKFTELKDLNEKLYKQSLVFQTIKSVIQEHDTLIGKSQEDIKKLRDSTLKNTQKFINSINIFYLYLKKLPSVPLNIPRLLKNRGILH